MKPVCKECEKEHKLYAVVMPQWGTRTLMGAPPDYWDEDGKFHEGKDPNFTTYEYHCSNGHSWRETK